MYALQVKQMLERRAFAREEYGLYMKYIVTQSRKSDYPNPIKLRKGDRVTTKENSDNSPWENWIKCELNGISGWVPVQILEILNSDKAIVKQDYESTEMEITVNEIVIAELELNGWIWARRELPSNEHGWIPLDNIKPLE